MQGAPAAPPRPGVENPATGPDGSFVLDGLRAGATYDLQVFLGGGLGPGPALKGVLAPTDGVEVVVAGAGRIEGSAVDAKTGQPLVAFDVSYEPERMGGMVFRVARRAGVGGRGGAGDRVRVESEDGRFALEDVPAGKWSVVVEAKGYQVARAGGVTVEEATTTDGVEVKVPPGTALRGRVVDAKTGRPVVEANVVATAAGTPGGFPGLAGLDAGGLLTDADGRFEVEGLAPGRVSLRVDHADYEDRTETVELKEGGSTVEVALSRGGALGGVVVSATRQPAAGADVTLQVSGEGASARGPLGGASQSAVTDASGRFRFDHLSAGRYSAAAQLSGQASEPQSAVLTGGESKEDLVLVLAGGATLRGVVSGLPEAQRAGVQVSANGPQQYSASARTGADGRFELTGLPAGTTSLRATAGDFLSGATRSASGSVTVAEGQLEAEASIVFEGTAALSGTVTRGGRPVSGAMVFAGPRRGARTPPRGRTTPAPSGWRGSRTASSPRASSLRPAREGAACRRRSPFRGRRRSTSRSRRRASPASSSRRGRSSPSRGSAWARRSRGAPRRTVGGVSGARRRTRTDAGSSTTSSRGAGTSSSGARGTSRRRGPRRRPTPAETAGPSR